MLTLGICPKYHGETALSIRFCGICGEVVKHGKKTLLTASLGSFFTISTFGHKLKYVQVNTAWDHELSLQTEYYLAPYENPTRDIVRK